MRTDLVTAWLIHQWVRENAPDVATQWQLEVDEQIKGMAQGVASLLPNVAIQVTGQHLLARASIKKWGLRNVALIGGGTPTPLSPAPEQLRYYTDSNGDVVADAASAGYTAMQINATQSADLKQLDGATTAIATGLFHFLPDVAVPTVLNALAEAEFEHVIFNHGNRNAEEGGAEIRERYSKMGVNIYPRTVDEVQALIPPDWACVEVIPQPECLKDDPLMAPHVDDLPNITDVYRLSRI